MPDRVLDLRLFRYALASAEHGSFRRAAAALNVQQSTVSRGIRNLEYRLGSSLFERGHAGIRPTPAGQWFLTEASLGFDHLERAVERLCARQRGEDGELKVASSVPFLLLGDLFERFRDEYQGVSIEIAESTCHASHTLVQQRKVDVAFAAKPSLGGSSRSLHLRDAQLIVALPRPHRLTGVRAMMLEELQSEQLILSAGGVGPEVANYLGRRMSRWESRPDIQLHRVSQCDLVSMVARGFGVAILVGPFPQSAPREVTFIPLAGRNIVSLHAVWMDSNPNPALEGLLKIAREIASVRRSDTCHGDD